MSKKRVYVAYTGGTIGMLGQPKAYSPAPGYLAERLAKLPELAAASMPEIEFQAYEPLLDSADMTPSDWLKIAQDIAAHYADFDGFLVLHGTDTMAYTASALPFMLEGLAKPVIMTGAQIPLCEVRNDGHDNLIAALLIAGNYRIPEVCVLFGSSLMRGCRTTKVDSLGLEAFASPNFAPLGTLARHIQIHWERVRPTPPSGPLRVRSLEGAHVGALRLFPGIRAEIVRNFLRPPLEGLVLEAFGVGNGPSRNREFLEALEEATDRGVVIVATTQCLRGAVDLSGYATGEALAKVGVIGGGDMTPEAALAKLHYLFSCGLSPAEVRAQVPLDLRGELTPVGSPSSPASHGARL
jgi:L-asparaginase